MKNYFFYLFFVCFSIQAQNTNINFPDAFLGVYKGTLKITSLKGDYEIPMEFHLLKTDKSDSYEYTIVYDGKPRNYNLIVENKEKGVFNIDENNGIILPAFYNNNVLYSLFEVQQNFLSTRLDFSNKENLVFEILFSNVKKKVTTGGTLYDKDSVKITENPKVYGFPISVIQKAILKKQ